jgi:hypothetical protein
VADFTAFDPATPYPPHMWCLDDTERALFGSLTSGALLEASRGCPWACSYCAKGPVRDRFDRRPVRHVARELAALVERGVDYVFFIDETFNLPGPAHQQLLDALAELPVSFGFQGRADLMTPAMTEALAAAGCVYAELGVDVVSDPLARQIGRRQHLDRCRQGIATAQSGLPIVRFNRLNLSTLDYVDMYGDRGDLAWDYPPDPAYPYPGAPLGDALMARYGFSEFNWPFAERYAWWLRLEVHLQRSQPDLARSTVQELKRVFLDLEADAAAAMARSFEPLVSVSGFHDANKSINGAGANVRVRHPRAERG